MEGRAEARLVEDLTPMTIMLDELNRRYQDLVKRSSDLRSYL
jgi:hypothetical protein